jgi:hypothetical protein
MKLLALFTGLLFSISVLANSDFENYNISPGSLHKGGSAKVSSKLNPNDQNKLDIKIDFEIIKKPFAPVPSEWLKGSLVETYPEKFRHEDFYIELEQRGSMSYEKMQFTHLGRADIGSYENCHKIRIVVKGGDVDVHIETYYHPAIGHAGWVEFDLIITRIPIIKQYKMHARHLSLQ